MNKMWKSIEVVVTLWGFLTIVAIVLDVLGILPYYDIEYRKKTEITPRIFLYPGQNIRLSAEFARSVDSQNIERVVWSLRDSSGKEYGNLPRLKDIDVTLIPDFSDTVNVMVKAKLLDEKEERHGSGSIQIIQTKPHKLTLKDGTFVSPTGLEKIILTSMQLYGGSANWFPASAATEHPGKLRLMAEGRPFPTWDGKAYIRYKLTGDPRDIYQYQTVTALQANK